MNVLSRYGSAESVLIGFSFLVYLAPVNDWGSLTVYSYPFLLVPLLLSTGHYRLRRRDFAIVIAAATVYLVYAGLTGDTANYFVFLLTFGHLLYLLVERTAFSRSILGTYLTLYVLFASVLAASVLVLLWVNGFPWLLPVADFHADKLGRFYDRQVGHHILPLTLYLGSALTFLLARIRQRRSLYGLSLLFLVTGLLPSFNASIIALVLAGATWCGYLLFERLPFAPRRSITRSAITGFLVMLITIGSVKVGLNDTYFFNSLTRPFVDLSVESRAPDKTTTRKYQGTPIKIKSHFETLLKLPRKASQQPIIGLGWGTYSSRAALFLSGVYLPDHPSYVPVSRHPVAETMIFKYREKGFTQGTLNQPWSSWQSLYAEGGLLTVTLVIGLFLSNVLKVRRWARGPNSSPRFLTATYFWMTFGLLFFLYQMLFTNLLEYPWVVGPFLLGFSLVPSSPDTAEPTA